MTIHNNDPATTTRRDSAPRSRTGRTVLAAALGFVAFYFATDFVAPNLATSAPPLPDDPVRAVGDWYAENQLAAVMIGVSQFLSVCCLGAFALGLPRAARSDAQHDSLRRARTWGLVAMALMMLSSVLGWLLAATAPTTSLDTALGIFVWLASRTSGFGAPVRGLATVAAVVAVLSLASLLWFYASAFILLGRLLCMLWTICAAASILRGTTTGRWA